MYKLISLLLLSGTPTLSALAGKADVLEAEVDCDGRVCDFAVTVRHVDEGWQHYADRWEVLESNGVVIGTRELAHPHEHEQPFTRSLSNVEIPPEMHEVIIRAHDSVHGYGGRELTVKIPR